MFLGRCEPSHGVWVLPAHPCPSRARAGARFSGSALTAPRCPARPKNTLGCLIVTHWTARKRQGRRPATLKNRHVPDQMVQSFQGSSNSFRLGRDHFSKWLQGLASVSTLPNGLLGGTLPCFWDAASPPTGSGSFPPTRARHGPEPVRDFFKMSGRRPTRFLAAWFVSGVCSSMFQGCPLHLLGVFLGGCMHSPVPRAWAGDPRGRASVGWERRPLCFRYFLRRGVGLPCNFRHGRHDD
jgi:hypothetical protein